VWYSGARGSWAWFVLISVAALSISVLLESKAGIRLDATSMLVSMIILTGYLALAQRRIRPFPEGASLGSRTYVVSAEGLRERSRQFDTLTRWCGVREVDETPDHIFVFIDNCQAHIVPKRAFASADECRRFSSELRRRLAGTYDEAPAASLPEPAGI
jgi:hypothetical protein